MLKGQKSGNLQEYAVNKFI